MHTLVSSSKKILTHTHTHTHQVLYHTLQTFAWKIDAKAAINAFCSLARLDTARLVQIAEPGRNSWEMWAKVDRVDKNSRWVQWDQRIVSWEIYIVFSSI